MMASTDVELAPASKSERDVVGRLLEFNSYEFSRIDGRSIGQDGLYGYRYLDVYWSEVGRVPYFIRADGELAGLALVRRVDAVMCVAEFLVLPKFRRTGVGTRAARQLFAAHQGPWQVRQVVENDHATSFWRRAIPAPFTEVPDDKGNITQTFDF
jgi:predicted acetyltransferase